MITELLLDPDLDEQRLLSHVIEYYHNSLKNSPPGLDYLGKRGVNSAEAIQRFRVGYADRTLGAKLPSKQIKAGHNVRTRLERLGVYRSSGHEHFNGCVVFPIQNSQGQIVDIYGRKTSQRLRKGIRSCMQESIGKVERGWIT